MVSTAKDHLMHVVVQIEDDNNIGTHTNANNQIEIERLTNEFMLASNDQESLRCNYTQACVFTDS